MPKIELSHLYYAYDKDHPEDYTVEDISFVIEEGEFVGLIGQTGSGKSTLIQHLNGLLKATKGDLKYGGESIYRDRYDLRQLRFEVGLVFQYPEHQLFETTVLADEFHSGETTQYQRVAYKQGDCCLWKPSDSSVL